MEFSLWSFILNNLEAAGAIGGYVSLSIIGFSLISFASKKRIDRKGNQIGPKWAHPIIGSFLGAIPGCGATIIVASLYKNKKISFGGLFATFISTLGEGSFVLLGASNEADVAGNLKAYATITIFGLLAGIIFGYLFDTSGIRANYDDNHERQEENEDLPTKQNNLASAFIENIGFYAIISMAIFLAPGSIMALWGGGIDAIADLTYWVSIAITIICIAFHFVTRFIYKNNFLSTLNSLELCKFLNTKFIYISSSRVYNITALNNIKLKIKENSFALKKNKLIGLTSKGINENFSTNSPLSFYGSTKLISENLVQEYCKHNKTGLLLSISYLIVSNIVSISWTTLWS